MNNNTIIIIPAMIPPIVPNTAVIQKLRNTIKPKQIPVNGPPNLAQKAPTSILFFAPTDSLVTISPWIATGVPPPNGYFWY